MQPYIALSDGQRVVPISSTASKWADDFNGTALNPDLWEVIENTGGMTYSVSSSNLVINMNTTANAVLRILSRKMITIPFDAYVSFSMSQRISNNNFYIDLIEVDPVTGVPVDNPNRAGDWDNRASARFTGTSSTTWALEALGEAASNFVTSSQSSMPSTAYTNDLCLELRPHDVIMSGNAADSGSARSSSVGRISTSVPDPNRTYKIQIRCVNGATAPASNTSVTIRRVALVDIQELVVEVSSGRGDQNPQKAIPINIAGGTVTPEGTQSTDLTSAAITASQTTTLSSNIRRGGSFQISIPVTAVSGTSPTLDIVVQESLDSGNTWTDVYHFDRITSSGVYVTPILTSVAAGTFRVVQTIGGTTPSFTYSILRTYTPLNDTPARRRFISRTIDPNTLNSASQWFYVEGSDRFELAVVLSVFGTSPTFHVEVSEDGVTATGASAVVVTPNSVGYFRAAASDYACRFVRIRVATAGTGNTLSYARLAAWKS